MMEKTLDIFFRDTDGESHADQLPARSADQTNRLQIDLFNPANPIECHIADRGEIEKIDVTLDGDVQFSFSPPKSPKRDRSCHFGFLAVDPIHVMAGNPLPHGRGGLRYFSRFGTSDFFAARPCWREGRTPLRCSLRSHGVAHSSSVLMVIQAAILQQMHRSAKSARLNSQ
jgi:hypothetical protein